MLEPLLHADGWISLITLAAMEIVLGIDNIVFLSIMTQRVPAAQQRAARQGGLALALLTRLGLLLTISWVMGLKEALFTVLARPISGRDIILFVGGLFLIGKSTHEIYEKLEVKGEEEDEGAPGKGTQASLVWVVVQIAIVDIVFSLDSVITAVGMAKDLSIMMIAMVIAMLVMLLFAGAVGRFVQKHPSMTILALSFLILIGVMLVAESLGQHVSKGYVYFAMSFSLGVELVNMRFRKKRASPVKLHRSSLAPVAMRGAPPNPPPVGGDPPPAD